MLHEFVTGARFMTRHSNMVLCVTEFEEGRVFTICKHHWLFACQANDENEINSLLVQEIMPIFLSHQVCENKNDTPMQL